MNKNIIIEDGLNLYKKTGQGQYSVNLYNFLKNLDFDVKMARKPFLEKIKNSTIKRVLYILWINLVFPFTVLFHPAKIIIFTNTLTPLYKLPNKDYYSVLHDLWSIKSPETVTKMQSLYLRFVIFSIKRTYKKIITVSNTVKNEIADFFKCEKNDIAVIYNYFSFGEKPAVNYTEEEQRNILQDYNIENKKYILSVATLNKRKNIPALIEAYKKLNTDLKLVLVGNASSEKFNTKNQNIIFTGYVDDEILKVLYKNAFLYVFPSVYEGFGIPIIDAQAFGIPVICSDIPVFREIGGDGVKYCSIDSVSYTNAITELINNTKQRENLIENGRKNAERFYKDSLIRQIEGVIKNAG